MSAAVIVKKSPKSSLAKSSPMKVAKPATKTAAKTAAKPAPQAETTTPTTAGETAIPAKAPKKSKAVKYISRDKFRVGDEERHLRVAEYQDYTFSINGRTRLTDAELAANWQEQFPNAVKFTLEHVRGARRDYNGGTHSKTFRGRKNPADRPWVDQDGRRVQVDAPKSTVA